MPNISIIVPTYNSSNFVYNLSKSIVEQTYEDFEVIIVDNFSKDGTIDKIKSQTRNDQRFKYFKIKNDGVIAKSRNYGIQKSSGQYIAFHDSDDYWLKTKLEKSLTYFPKYDFVYHLMKIKNSKNIYYNNKKLFSYQLSKNPFVDLMTCGNPISTSSVILKKSIINKINFFSEDKKLISIEDYDCWINLSKKNIKFKEIKDVLGEYNISDSSTSSVLKKMQLKIYKINFIYIRNKNLLLHKDQKQVSKNHFRYLIANDSNKINYKISVYFSLLFKKLPKVSKIKLLLKVIYFKLKKKND